MRLFFGWPIFGGIGLLISIATLLFHYLLLPIAVRHQVSKTLSLENGTESWDRFVVTPIPILLSVYFFRVNNPTQIVNGEKPNVTQIGPYVYREEWTKTDLRLDEEKDTIFYRQRIKFIFDKNMSDGRSEDDFVTIVNPLPHLIDEVVEAMPALTTMEEVLEFALPEILGPMYAPVLTLKVRDLLFDGLVIRCNGTYARTLSSQLICSSLLHYIPITNANLDTDANIRASLLTFKKLSGVLEVMRGSLDPSNLGKIVSYEGQQWMNHWRCKEANRVQGSEMTLFPPFVTTATTIQLFVSDIVTSIPLKYERDVNYKDIPGYKFTMEETGVFGDPLIDRTAACYCPGPMKEMTVPAPCLKEGVLDISSVIGVPALVSMPHLYRADEEYQEQVVGLAPDPHLHQPFIEIEPTTGIPLRGMKRMQVNVMTGPRSSMRMFQNHCQAVFPILWMEEGAELGNHELSMLKDQLLKLMNILDIIRWTLFAVGLAIFAVNLFMAIRRKNRR